MQPGALKALEFDRIVAAVGATGADAARRRAAGRARSRCTTRPTCRAALADHRRRRAFPLGRRRDRAPRARRARRDRRVAGRRGPRPRTAASARPGRRSSRRWTRPSRGIRRARAAFPLLAALAEGAASFERGDRRRPPQDRSGRRGGGRRQPGAGEHSRRLRKQRTRLRGTLESYLRGKDTAKYLQQQIVTDRNGRYVLVVRAENRTAIPGIVHGSSASGASLFLEPLSTVEINNDIVALEQQEQEEVRRILLALADALPAAAATTCSAPSTRRPRSTCVQAKARYSLEIDGVAPAIASDGRLELRAARHPLLIRRCGDAIEVGRRRRRCVRAGRRSADSAGACWSSPARTPAARPSR